MKLITQSFILHFCNTYKLPLGVKSTALQLYSKIKDRVDTNVHNFNYFCIFLAVKIEGIQENFIKKFEQFYDRNLNSKTLFKIEDEVFELLEFDLDFINLYSAMYAVKINYINNEGNVEYLNDWNTAVINLDKLLCLNNEYSYHDLIKVALGVRECENYSEISYALKQVEILSKSQLFKELDKE